MSSFDRRFTPARPDLAALWLKGIVEAARYVEGQPARIIAPSTPLYREPRLNSAIDTEAIAGEAVMVFEQHGDFAWVQLLADSYVGYVPANALAAEAHPPTHKVNVLRSFVYPGASIKLAPVDHFSFGAAVCVVAEICDFAQIASGGFVWRAHLAQLGDMAPDAVAVAETFIGIPYLWGGKTSLGMDCSGLVQLALNAAGHAAPRDSDMQENELGKAIDIMPDLTGLQRGDLVFWKGHVGMMRDEMTLLHANGHHMLVASEPVDLAAKRILHNGGGSITRIKRLA